ncbi:MAG: DUF2163 domain-containing protein [Hyphomicrobium sp.]
MKALPAALQAHLASGATTLCWCWRLVRSDGVTMGFTDHDRDLVFDGTTFEAAAGFEASEIRSSVGLSVDNLEVTSALTSERLTEPDLAAGLYDDAKVEIFRVNWQDTVQRVAMRTGSLGEVKRAGTTFAAEVRGLSHYLQQTKGRVFQYTCDADVGDARCGVAIAGAGTTGSGTVAAVASPRRFMVSGLDGYPHDWFTRGLARFTSGAALDQAVEVKAHAVHGGVVTIELWQPARGPLLPGQSFVVTAGCDKHLATCAAKFGNTVNFRGFPHMPGNDILTRVARSGGG